MVTVAEKKVRPSWLSLKLIKQPSFINSFTLTRIFYLLFVLLSDPIPRKVETRQIRLRLQFISQINKLNLRILFWLTRKLKINHLFVARTAITKYMNRVA